MNEGLLEDGVACGQVVEGWREIGWSSSVIMVPDMDLEDVIRNKVRHLPLAQQQEVLRFAEKLQDRADAHSLADRNREIRWIDANREKYPDHWVAVEEDRLVGADKDALGVYRAARAEGIRSPFVVHVVPQDPLPFVPGW
jgi:hypothetical protein